MTETELKKLLSAPDWPVEPAPSFADDLERLLLGVLEGDVEAPRPEPQPRRLALAVAAAVILVAALAALEAGTGEPDAVPADATTPTITSTTSTTAVEDESITVTSDVITVGPGLITDDLAQIGDLTYVVAGRASTQVDDRGPEAGVVVAFGSTGEELWRTELTDIPHLVAADEESVWVAQFETGTAVRLDPSNGEIMEAAHPILPTPLCCGPEEHQFAPVGLEIGFGSVWMHTIRGAVARIEADGSWIAVEIPGFGPHGMAIGVDAVWVALGSNGVARIDAVDNELTVISIEAIGHRVEFVAVDGDAVFVAEGDYDEPGRVSSIVDGAVRATVDLDAPIRHLGKVFGFFGVLTNDGLFAELIAEEPMIIDVEQTFNLDTDSLIFETQGSAWLWEYPSVFRRLHLVASAVTSPIPLIEPTGRRPIPDEYVLSPDWERLPGPPINPRWPGTFVWTGTEVVIFGGEPIGGGSESFYDGAAFNPTTNTWRVLDESLDFEVESRVIETSQQLVTSGLSPNSRDGAWIGDDLVGVDYLLESALYDSFENAWRPGLPVPLGSMECSVKVHSVGETVVVDYCGRLAVGGPEAWTPLDGPILGADFAPFITAGADTIWAYSQDGLFRLTADLDDPSSFRRLPLGPTAIDLPAGWTVQGHVTAEPITIEVTGPGGQCTMKAYEASAGPLLTELARDGFLEASVDPLVGGKPYRLIEYTPEDGTVHLAGAPFSTSVIDVGCADRQTAVQILRSIVWPWQ
jgi:streptogramin lyase